MRSQIPNYWTRMDSWTVDKSCSFLYHFEWIESIMMNNKEMEEKRQERKERARREKTRSKGRKRWKGYSWRCNDRWKVVNENEEVASICLFWPQFSCNVANKRLGNVAHSFRFVETILNQTAYYVQMYIHNSVKIISVHGYQQFFLVIFTSFDSSIQGLLIGV